MNGYRKTIPQKEYIFKNGKIIPGFPGCLTVFCGQGLIRKRLETPKSIDNCRFLNPHLETGAFIQWLACMKMLWCPFVIQQANLLPHCQNLFIYFRPFLRNLPI
jgi:hypothetical protein